jgi:hypothetical protein
MSEYHDTNEDERDWTRYKRERYNIGMGIREDGTTRKLRGILAKICRDTGDQWIQAGFHGLPFQSGGYETLP